MGVFISRGSGAGAGEDFGVGELVFGELADGEGLGDEGEEEEESHSGTLNGEEERMRWEI